MPNNILNIETQAGKPIVSGNLKIIPFSQALTIRFPFFNGSLIWNRPVSILVVTADGQEQLIPIQDMTRITQIVLFSVAAIGTLLIWFVFRTVRK